MRGWAAEELAKRPEAKEMVPQLIAMAEGSDAHIRQGACETLGYIKSPEALPVLVRLLTHEDRWLRVKAANALKNMGDTAKPVIPDMLKAVAVTGRTSSADRLGRPYPAYPWRTGGGIVQGIVARLR